MMPEGILGRKLGMTQVFEEDGRLTPVTVVEAGPCRVVQRKTAQKDGYEAVQLAFDEVAERKVNKPMRGHFARVGVAPARKLVEFRIEDSEKFQALNEGDTVKVDIFTPGEYVDVTGITKGKGFAGSIKRWNLDGARCPTVHATTGDLVSLGAVDPARVFKGRKLPGRMGGERRTIQGLRIVEVDPEKN